MQTPLLALELRNQYVNNKCTLSCSDQSCHFFQNLLVDSSLYICYSVHAQRTKLTVVASSSPSDKFVWHFMKTSNQKRELVNKNKCAAKNQKVVTLEVKFTANVNVVLEKIARCGNADTTTIQKTCCQRNSVKVSSSP